MIRIVRAFAEREAVPLEERLRRSITARRRGR